MRAAAISPGVCWTVSDLLVTPPDGSEIRGHPTLTDGPGEVPAVRFDGRGDGIVVPQHPLAGVAVFTLEAILRPRDDGPWQQRCVHVQADGADSRALLELRRGHASTWYADTFLASGGCEQPLNDPMLTHSCARWHALALVCRGDSMTQYVDRERELEAPFAFAPWLPGPVSLGMRLNRVFPFAGDLWRVRFTAAALAPSDLLQV